jgi:hypothetical protein
MSVFPSQAMVLSGNTGDEVYIPSILEKPVFNPDVG